MSEILAPAGDKNSAIAAINAGADAIYLGLKAFSARAAADNFDFEGLKDICSFCHLCGVKVYAALNTVVQEDELEEFFSAVSSVWASGADAVILQDMPLGAFIHSRAPQITLHLSTQAGVCNLYGARLAAELGFKRVILARETPLEEMESIAAILETEVFIQGALCTCFSGQCYMSSFAGGNSGNRGRCKQPCRRLYSIDRAGFEEAAYALSLADLCVGERVLDLQRAGVKSFKIEGRLRRPEYVFSAVTYYKNILGGCSRPEDLSALKRAYNRGNYTRGLAFGQDGSLISRAVQGHIGEYVGVVRVENGRYVCLTSQKFRSGDGFKLLRAGREVGGAVFGGECRGGFALSTRSRLKSGDKVFITTDTRLGDSVPKGLPTVPVHVKCRLNADRPARIEIEDFVFSGEAPQRAHGSPLTAERIVQCFSKTDLYPFKPDIEVETDGVFMPLSALNALRRSAYAAYYGYVRGGRKESFDFTLPAPVARGAENRTAVICADFRGIRADIAVYKPADYSKPVDFGGFAGERFLYLPPFMTDEEISALSPLIAAFDGVYCDGCYGLPLAKSSGKKFFAGTGWNVANSISLEGAFEAGADYVCLSKEITARQARDLGGSGVFYLFAGNIKVMDLIYCPFGRSCKSCDRRVSYTLTDGEGRSFPLRRYAICGSCRFEVYNCADLICGEEAGGRLLDCSITAAPALIEAVENGDLRNVLTNYTRGHTLSRIR